MKPLLIGLPALDYHLRGVHPGLQHEGNLLVDYNVGTNENDRYFFENTREVLEDYPYDVMTMQGLKATYRSTMYIDHPYWTGNSCLYHTNLSDVYLPPEVHKAMRELIARTVDIGEEDGPKNEPTFSSLDHKEKVRYVAEKCYLLSAKGLSPMDGLKEICTGDYPMWLRDFTTAYTPMILKKCEEMFSDE